MSPAGHDAELNMRLSELKSVLDEVKVLGDPNVEITDITYDSRKAAAGTIFVALVGATVDGHRYADAAVEAGASALVVEREVPGVVVPQLVVPNSRRALGKIARRFCEDPSKHVKVIGVTGTNGKTTVTCLMRSIFEAAGERPGVIGTISYVVGDREIPAVNTTPESLNIQEMLAEMLSAGVNYAAVEVSSHALDQYRVDDVTFAAGVFTNLTPEHLDYHKDMTSYAQAKSKLFATLSKDAVAVVNADDRYSSTVSAGTQAKKLSYGFSDGADVRVRSLECDSTGNRFEIESPWGVLRVTTALPGRHNVYNCLAALTVTAALGLPVEKAVEGIAALQVIPGRLERVDEGQDFRVFVDYAHSDDALENVLTAVRDLTDRRVIVVFGCGGDRDVTKRPRMRAVAEELADHAVVTSDNPRSEDPRAIIDQIMTGVRDRSKFTVEPDRRAAVAAAVRMAKPGDVVLIAGKGHETYQILRDRRVHFDDREVAREELRKVVARCG